MNDIKMVRAVIKLIVWSCLVLLPLFICMGSFILGVSIFNKALLIGPFILVLLWLVCVIANKLGLLED